MILPDANLLLYAEDSLSSEHEAARAWWDNTLGGQDPVYLCWPVINSFLRIATNPRLYLRPLTLEEAISRVRSWMAQPCVDWIGPTEQHWGIFQDQLRECQARGNLVSDAHLAALAIEHACTLYSTDQDFARFPALKWVNPLKRRGRN